MKDLQMTQAIPTVKNRTLTIKLYPLPTASSQAQFDPRTS